MKRILDSSRTLSNHLVRSNSKSRRPYSRDFISNEKKPSKLPNSVISNAKRHVSIATLDTPDEGMVDLDLSRQSMPEKLNWYWNLDEDHKRKITDPTYVRQAVQDTFMQRAQGGYHYKRSSSVRNSSSAKSTQSGNQRKPEGSLKSATAKPAKPPPPSPDKVFPKPQAPKRKRIIDTAKPMQLRPKVQTEQRRIKSGAHLKEAGQKQLEEAKKKLYQDHAPAVLDYLIEKHVPKMSGLQMRVKHTVSSEVQQQSSDQNSGEAYHRHNSICSLTVVTRGRKEKPSASEAPQLPAVPSLMQRVFGWKGKDEPKKNESDISITPRSIEVRNRKSGKLVGQKQNEKADSVETEVGRSRKKRRSAKIRISLRGSAKKETVETEKKQRKTAEELKEKNARQAQAEEDREAIWSKMKASTAPVVRTTQEVASVKRQVRDFELTPQIYPKGSLSMRKSYLPITACRPRSDVSRPTESNTSVYAVKPEESRKEEPSVKESPSITDHILESLKNIFSKMRRNSA